MSRSRILVVLLTIVSMVAALQVAANAAGRGEADEHRRISEYWTAERIANAQSRDLLRVDPRTGRVVPQAKGGTPGKPGGGDGGGGGGDSETKCNPRKGCAPTVTITDPDSGATVSDTITISGTAADSDGTVTAVTVTAAGTDLGTTGTTTWSASWDTKNAANGSQTISVSATDDTGRSTTTSITVTVENVVESPSQPTVTGEYWPGSNGGNGRLTTGRVLFAMGGTNYVCSGTLVDGDLTDATRPAVVLTAGHCVHDATDGYATYWAFFPDYETNKSLGCTTSTYGCWTAAELVAHTNWVNGEDFRYDAAFVRLNSGGHGGTPITDVIPASQGISFTDSLGDYVDDLGYPAGSPYNGQRLVWCAGTTETDPYGGGTQGLLCDMTGGSSGGGWFQDFSDTTELGFAVSVNSYKYIMPWDTGRMYGPRFGNWTNQLYTAALN